MPCFPMKTFTVEVVEAFAGVFSSVFSVFEGIVC